MFKNRNRITKTIRKKSISADGDESKYIIFVQIIMGKKRETSLLLMPA